MPRRTKLSILAFAALWLAAPSPAQGRAPGGRKEVLILNSYHAGFEWTDELNRGLRSVLAMQDFEVEIWVEYLDTRRNQGAPYLALQRRQLEEEYGNKPLDLIIATDDDATALLEGNGHPIFAGTPVVFCGVSGAELLARLPRSRFTGLIEVFEQDSLLDRIVRLRPKTSKVVFVRDGSVGFGDPPADSAELRKRHPHLAFDYLDGGRLSFEEILEALRRVRREDLVIISTYTLDRDGSYLSPVETRRRMTEASRAPVVNQNSGLLGEGLLAVRANQGFEHGRMAAEMALKVLRGVRPAGIEFQRHAGWDLLVDYSAATRFGLPAGDLPEGARIVNRPPNWSEYYRENRLAVLGALAFVLLQTGIIAALFWSVARRKRAEAALRASQAKLERAQEIAHLGIWEREITGDRLVWSDEVYRIYGVTRETFQPSRAELLARIHADDRERVRLILKDADARESDRAVEYRVVRPDGTIRHIQVDGRWLRRPDGTSHVDGTVQDVTHLKEMEAHVQHALRVDSLGNLAGGIAHDFNNLLTVINGYCELLLLRFREEGPARTQIQEIHRAGSRAAELTGKLLTFSRKHVVQATTIELNGVVSAMEGMLKPLLGETIQLRFELAPDLAAIRLDRAQLEHSILNLATNARDAMPQGGTLTISTSTERINTYQSSHGFQVTPGPYIVLTVADTGCGMTAETRERIFEPFFTTKEMGKGTGLGLSTVYGMVQSSGGLVRVESGPERGSAFRLLFPAVAGEVSEVTPPAAPEPPTRGSERILLVEDELNVRTLMAETLKSMGYTVLTADDGVGALALMPAGSPPVDLLITDVMMPGMNGPELAALLRLRHPGLRVLFISGYSGGQLPVSGVGADAPFLGKPFRPKQLGARVREVLAAPPPAAGI